MPVACKVNPLGVCIFGESVPPGSCTVNPLDSGACLLDSRPALAEACRAAVAAGEPLPAVESHPEPEPEG